MKNQNACSSEVNSDKYFDMDENTKSDPNMTCNNHLMYGDLTDLDLTSSIRAAKVLYRHIS